MNENFVNQTKEAELSIHYKFIDANDEKDQTLKQRSPVQSQDSLERYLFFVINYLFILNLAVKRHNNRHS